MNRTCPQCERPFRPNRPHQIYDIGECRYQGWIQKEVEAAQAADQRVEVQPLREVRAQQEEGDASADYLILAREQIARTLLHTGWFTADDLEPLGIPQQYRRSVHGSATGYFSGEQPYMLEAGRRKSERPERKGAKNTVFRITAKGRRELPKLLKEMAGPVRDASKRLYGDRLVGVDTNNREGQAVSNGASLDRPDSSHTVSPSGARSSFGVDPGETSAVGSTHGASSAPAGEPRPSTEPVPLFEDTTPSAYDPWKDAA